MCGRAPFLSLFVCSLIRSKFLSPVFFFDSFRKGCFQASKREEGLKENTEREREREKKKSKGKPRKKKKKRRGKEQRTVLENKRG